MTDHAEGALQDSAIKGDVVRLIALLETGADINERYGDGTALMMAASAGRAATVRVLLERGAEIDLTDDLGTTALLWTLLYGIQMDEPEGGVTVVRLLLEYGADANYVDERDETPLQLAALEGSVESIELLLRYGANIHAGNDDALITAAAHAQAAAAQVLLEAGADINATGMLDWTPLHHAVHNSNVDCVKLFLAAGADVNALDNAGLSVLALARERNNREIIGLLTEDGAAEKNP